MKKIMKYKILDKDNPIEGQYWFNFLGWNIAHIYHSVSGWRVTTSLGGDVTNTYLDTWKSNAIPFYGPIPKPEVE